MVEERGLAWPHVWEADGFKSETARLYNVNRLPLTYLLDREGRIAAKAVRGEAIEEAVAELIRK